VKSKDKEVTPQDKTQRQNKPTAIGKRLRAEERHAKGKHRGGGKTYRAESSASKKVEGFVENSS